MYHGTDNTGGSTMYNDDNSTKVERAEIEKVLRFLHGIF